MFSAIHYAANICTEIFETSLGIFAVILFYKRKWYASDKPQSSFRIESGGRVESCRRFWALSLAKILAHLGERALVYSPLNFRVALYAFGFDQ